MRAYSCWYSDWAHSMALGQTSYTKPAVAKRKKPLDCFEAWGLWNAGIREAGGIHLIGQDAGCLAARCFGHFN